MKMNANEEAENFNLVMFPASKNFRQDPLNDLMYEYSHFNESNIPSYLDDRFESEELDRDQEDNEDAFESLEAFMNRHQNRQVMSPDDKLIKLINDRIDAINVTKERIKFYLDELDLFMPNHKK